MIFDCFTFYNELEILKLRLHELGGLVDRFVLVEASKTFQGDPKPLHFFDNRELFRDHLDKIDHIVVDFPADLVSPYGRQYSQAWAREHYQRDQIMSGLRAAAPDDLVIISDVDEIISANKLRQAISIRPKGALTIFEMPMFAYFYNRRLREADWLLGPRMIEFSHVPTPQKMRMSKAYSSKRWRQSAMTRLHTRLWNAVNCGIGNPVHIIADSGWHFTSIGDWANMRGKLAAFAHEELQQRPEFQCEQAFREMVAATTTPVELDRLPRYLQESQAWLASPLVSGSAQRVKAVTQG